MLGHREPAGGPAQALVLDWRADGAARGPDLVGRRAEKAGSWWPDWTAWLHARTGEMVPAYGAGRHIFPALADAPGTYVLEK